MPLSLNQIRSDITKIIESETAHCVIAINIASKLQLARAFIGDDLDFTDWINDLDMVIRGAYSDLEEVWELGLNYAGSFSNVRLTFPDESQTNLFGINLSIPVLIRLDEPVDRVNISNISIEAIRDIAASLDKTLRKANSDILAVVPLYRSVSCCQTETTSILENTIHLMTSGDVFGDYLISEELDQILESRLAQDSNTCKEAEFFRQIDEMNFESLKDSLCFSFGPPLIDGQYIALNIRATAIIRHDVLIGHLYLMESGTGCADMWSMSNILGLTGEMGQGHVPLMSKTLSMDGNIENWVEGPVCLSGLEDDVYFLVNRPYMDLCLQARQSGLDEPVFVFNIPECPDHPHPVFGLTEARVNMFGSNWDAASSFHEEGDWKVEGFCPLVPGQKKLICGGSAAPIFINGTWPSMAKELRDAGYRVISNGDFEMRGHIPPVSSLIQIRRSYA